MYISLFPDHDVIFVIAVVGISQFTVRPEFKLQELMTELAFVTHVVTQVKVTLHASQGTSTTGTLGTDDTTTVCRPPLKLA